MARNSVRKRHHKVSAKPKQRPSLSEKDFIIYLAAALTLKGVQWINKEGSVFIEALQEAYATVADAAGYTKLGFVLIEHQVHPGSCGIADAMVQHLCAHWARRGTQRHVLWLELTTGAAVAYLAEPRAGNKAMWLDAADAFLVPMRHARHVG